MAGIYTASSREGTIGAKPDEKPVFNGKMLVFFPVQ